MCASVHSLEPASTALPTDQFLPSAGTGKRSCHLAPATGTGDNFERMRTRLATEWPEAGVAHDPRRKRTSGHASTVTPERTHDARAGYAAVAAHPPRCHHDLKQQQLEAMTA